MKKNLMKVSLMVCLAFGIVSCGKKSEKNQATDAKTDASLIAENEMKGFMIGGIYAFYGFGGVAAVEKMAAEKDPDKKNLVNAYKDIMIFSFLKEDGEDCKKTLKDSWEIDSKAKLVETLDGLKNDKDLENSHKAWDYARLVNNVNMAYAANYLTEDESRKYISETLKLAQSDFKTWDDFLKDFNAGRTIWDPKAEDSADFEKISKAMLNNELYNTLPLN